MSVEKKIAGVLTAFGLAGLALSPFILTPAVSAPVEANVSIAISSGPQLRLLRADETAETESAASTRHLVCGRVLRLAFADVGFSCQTNAHLAAAASSRPGAIAATGH